MPPETCERARCGSEEELIDLLTAISVVAKRLATNMARLSVQSKSEE